MVCYVKHVRVQQCMSRGFQSGYIQCPARCTSYVTYVTSGTPFLGKLTHVLHYVQIKLHSVQYMYNTGVLDMMHTLTKSVCVHTCIGFMLCAT